MLKVLFFASLREQLGLSELSVDTSSIAGSGEDICINDLLDYLAQEQGEQIALILRDENIVIARNHETVAINEKIEAHDEIAFFPPVTGG